jgi:hypothetical protein
MWQPNKRCRVCALILSGESELQKRIYNSKYFNLTTGESLIDIQRSYGGQFHYNSLMVHVKRHQTVENVDRVRRSAQIIATRTENKIIKQKAEIKPDVVWEEVIEQGLEDLREGRIKLTANHLLKAASDKSTAQLKRKDQDIKLSEMIWHFASGESNESRAYDQQLIEGEEATSYNPAAITAASVDNIQDRPSDIHQPPVGDATALGASEVFGSGS